MWRWEENKEGVRAESHWPGQHYFFSLTELLLLQKLNFKQEYLTFLYSLLSFWLSLEVSRRDGSKVLHGFPMPYSFRPTCSKNKCPLRGTFLCPRPGLCHGPASSRSQCSSHTSTHWKEMIFWDGIRPCCLIYGEGAGCIGLSSGWVSSISLGCPHHYSLSALSSNTLIYYCGRNDWNL